ncbi:hypothetical protein ABFX02_08G042700 [Erythranthe guttata]
MCVVSPLILILPLLRKNILIMAFIISKRQQPSSSFSDNSEKLSFNNKDGGGENEKVSETVSTQLLLKPSPESLDKEVVLRRLRHHKTMVKVKNVFQAVLTPPPSPHTDRELYEEKWLQQGDSFTSP